MEEDNNKSKNTTKSVKTKSSSSKKTSSVNKRLKKDTKDILQEVTQKYVDMYGTSDLSEDDQECIQSLIGKI